MESNNIKSILNGRLEDIDYNIKKIEYERKKGNLKLFIDFNEFCNEKNLDLIQNDIKNNLNFLQDISFERKFNFNRDMFLGVFDDYWDELINKLAFSYKSLARAFSNSKYEIVDDRVYILIDDYFSYLQINNKGIDKKVQNRFKREFDFDFSFSFKYDEEAGKMSQECFEADRKEMIENHSLEIGTKYMETSVKKDKTSKNTADDWVIFRGKVKNKIVAINDGMIEESFQCFNGKVFGLSTNNLKSGKTILTFAITDFTNSIGIKIFLKEKETEDVLSKIKNDDWVTVEGSIRYDSFDKELSMYATNINKGIEPRNRMDNSEEKRVEFHMHSNMSDMDGITPVKDLIKRAISWGHKAIAITDHGVLQAFPDAMDAARGKDIKIIYGVEGYLMDNDSNIYEEDVDYPLDGSFVVFDLETTGLSPKYDGITEIGAVKIENGKIIDRYSTFVNPEKPIPAKIVELTGITDEMVKEAKTIDKILPEFLNFVGKSAVVAHNAKFDVSFIKENAKKIDKVFENIVVDTLVLSRLLITTIKRHKLNSIAKYFKISLENHHRAVDDANATAEIFIKFKEMLENENIYNVNKLNDLSAERMDYTKYNTKHVIILAKNQNGIKDLYEIVSHSNIKTFYKKPRIPKDLLSRKRENLIIGSACEAGELYSAIINNLDNKEIEKIASFYDYLEIQPLGNNNFLIEKGLVSGVEELKENNRKICALGEKLNKPVLATCDVHFLDPKDEIFRRILMVGQGYSDGENQPPLYLRTTEEMLDEFSYLGKEKAKEVVITNTNLISEMIEEVKPIPDGTSPPIIQGSDTELREMCYKKARKIYGDELPEIVEQRLERELNSIISNGYAVMYIIAQKLVAKSLEDGYLVGSRGSVGSSLAATMSDITEVSPLPPHYICKKCKKSEFILDGKYGSGADLPDKECPDCKIPYGKDGHDIPFEVFLGFEGDKEPDIDLNFAGEYQANAHKYTEVLFGEGYVYKAGTIGTIADKTAFGFVKKYFEGKDITANSKETLRLLTGCTGVKRTSGQHPGGIMVIPDYKDVHDFSPIQYPANDPKSGVITTHFDYHSLSGRILKLDILGHDVPTIIKNLEQLTGVDVQTIPLDDKETVKIFTSVESLNIKDEEYNEHIGSLGIPEFGTKFVRQMLEDTMPTTFAELVRISGLSHGTDVWINNAQNLVRSNVAELKDVISTRDDIMNYLIFMKLPNKEAFTIMERVRKGKGLTEENVELMKKNNVPQWYIDSCNKIKYMFPKAHAVAYVMMSFRIAYFKVHHPLAFYATYFSNKVDDFDAQIICMGKLVVKEKMKELINSENALTKKEGDLYISLEVALEMYSRGYEFIKVDLYDSDPEKFTLIDGKILCPLVSLQGVGINASRNIAEVRSEGEFLSIQDLKIRAKVSKTVIEALVEHGCLKGVPETNQLSLFSLQ